MYKQEKVPEPIRLPVQPLCSGTVVTVIILIDASIQHSDIIHQYAQSLETSYPEMRGNKLIIAFYGETEDYPDIAIAAKTFSVVEAGKKVILAFNSKEQIRKSPKGLPSVIVVPVNTEQTS
jgi:hypothetical protein